MIKQQQFYVFRVNSARLKESDYNIKLAVKQARNNKELISLGDSELLRQTRDYKELLKQIKDNKSIDVNSLNELLKKKKQIKKQKSSDENIKALNKIQDKIDKILFVPEIIVLIIRTTSQYKKMFYDHITINGKNFKRFICGSGHSRNSKVLFVEEETLNKIRPKLENGYDKTKELSPNKYNAYFSLYSSNTYKVRNLKFCVVKDLLVNIKRTVDFVFQDEKKSWVETLENHPIELKPHDGEGLITVRGAEKWSNDLDIDYTSGFFGVRNSFIKGMLITFSISEYIESVSKTSKFVDAWGKTRDANDYDIFLTTSQLKLWKNYNSLEDFTANIDKNNISWGVCRVAPNKDNHYCLTNYQYLQTLNMNEDDIKDLCQFNINWFKDILGEDAIHTALYLLGKGVNKINNMNDINNPMVKAILLNNKLANDPCIKNKINNSIKKKIKQTYAGKLLVRANYQTMLADPYSLAQNIFGEKPENCKGLLAEGEHYSSYWNNYGEKQVDACRSPLTHYSEHNLLNLKNDDETNNWYRYQVSGIIYPTIGLDTIKHADSDFDLDIVFTTSEPVFLRCAYKDMLPITYEKKTAPTIILTENDLFEADLLSFNNEIGIITNYSTEMYAMLLQFHKGSKAYNTMLERLKITRMLQGNAIDKAKGVKVQDFPETWIKRQKIIYKDVYDKEGKLIKKADTIDQIEEKKFLNKLVIDRKPYFQGHIYPKVMKKYKDYINKYEMYCKITFGCTFEELKNKKNKTKEENDFFRFYYKNIPVNVSSCVMNKLAWYMEGVGEEIKKDLKSSLDNIDDEIVNILTNNTIDFNEETFKKILSLYHTFCKSKRTHEKTVQQSKSNNKKDEESYQDLQMFYKEIRNKAYQKCSNTSELMNYVVEIVYKLYPKDKKDFLWDVFQNDVLVNVFKNKQEKVYFPIIDQEGDIEYLGNRFKLQEVNYDI